MIRSVHSSSHHPPPATLSPDFRLSHPKFTTLEHGIQTPLTPNHHHKVTFITLKLHMNRTNLHVVDNKAPSERTAATHRTLIDHILAHAYLLRLAAAFAAPRRAVSAAGGAQPPPGSPLLCCVPPPPAHGGGTGGGFGRNLVLDFRRPLCLDHPQIKQATAVL